LRDEGRTNLPIYYARGDGSLARAAAFRDGNLRTDLLFSYFPNPGTVVYLGYGGGYHEPGERGRLKFDRVNDGFFMKLSYLFRMRG
ncbi:MAG: hypothetical protein ABIZ70_09095, partial [Gemmatimonadales bacterium]